MKTDFLFDKPCTDDYYTSFEAFVEYIASNPGDSKMNGHWRTTFNLCSACALDYSIITHLDNSKEEIPFVLEKINLAGKVEIAEKYSWDGTRRIKDPEKIEEARKRKVEEPDLRWKNVPKETAALIYKHFFLDFVLFGYSPDDVLKVIKTADSQKKRPSQKRINLSRKVFIFISISLSAIIYSRTLKISLQPKILVKRSI